MPSLYKDALAAATRDISRALILAALNDCEGNVIRAARVLGISRAAVNNNMRALGITRDQAQRLRAITMPPVELTSVP